MSNYGRKIASSRLKNSPILTYMKLIIKLKYRFGRSIFGRILIYFAVVLANI